MRTLEQQLVKRHLEFRPNMHVQRTPPYMVDAVLEGRYIEPDEDNEIEMECFSLPKWQKTHFQAERCGCEDYTFDYITCVPGTGDYDNADGQDNDTSISVCVDPDVVCGVTPYRNACFDVSELDAPVICL